MILAMQWRITVIRRNSGYSRRAWKTSSELPDVEVHKWSLFSQKMPNVAYLLRPMTDCKIYFGIQIYSFEMCQFWWSQTWVNLFAFKSYIAQCEGKSLQLSSSCKAYQWPSNMEMLNVQLEQHPHLGPWRFIWIFCPLKRRLIFISLLIYLITMYIIHHWCT